MRLALSIGLALLTGLAAMAESSLRIRVDQGTVEVNQPFMITIEAMGETVGDPVIPDIDGLTISKMPANTASRMQVSINLSGSVMVRARELGYTAVAKREGKFQIPPIAVEIDGKVMQTQPLEVNVVAATGLGGRRNPGRQGNAMGAASPFGVQGAGTPNLPGMPGMPAAPAPPNMPTAQNPPPAPASPGSAGGGPNPPTSGELTWDDIAFSEAVVDKTEVFQGEGILLRLRLWRLLADGVAVGAQQDANFRYPDTEGFYAASFQPQTVQEQRNGWTYEVNEYQQLLYPTATGDLTIGAWHWEGWARAFTRTGIQRRNVTLDTKPIAIKVKPLPEQPAEFSGSVGSFTFDAGLSRTDAVQGVPVNLDLTITGKGNPNAIGEPKMPGIEKTYISDPVKNSEMLTDGITVKKTIMYAITPLEAGELTIPALSFCYFDPAAQQFQTITRGPFQVKVAPSAESGKRVWVGDNAANDNKTVDVLGEDIQPIMKTARDLAPAGSDAPLVAFAVLGPVLGYAGLALWLRRKERFARDTGFARGYRAKSRGLKRLKQVEQSADPAEDLYRALTGFVADKFNVPEAGITSADVRRLLEEHGGGEELVSSYMKILKACERARYASAKLSADEIQALVNAALPAVDALDGLVKRPGGKKPEARS